MKTLLIVDDEAEVLESLKRALRNEPYHLITTTRPTEALSLLEEHPVDLLISDIDMPELSGIELMARAKRSRPDVVRILLTGGVSIDKVVRAINEGEVHRYLTKPWDKAELIETLRQAVARLDELRRSNQAARNAELRRRILVELEREYPGVTAVELQEGVYILDIERLEPLVASHEALKAFFSR
jgi:YesN/AraC family two-component response regulator